MGASIPSHDVLVENCVAQNSKNAQICAESASWPGDGLALRKWRGKQEYLPAVDLGGKAVAISCGSLYTCAMLVSSPLSLSKL